ncbi:MAG: flagellar hook-length control protein FliK [Sphingomonas bacterium]
MAALFPALLAPVKGEADDGAPARQEDAAPGKDLPEGGDQADALAWLAAALWIAPAAQQPTQQQPALPEAPVSQAAAPQPVAVTPQAVVPMEQQPLPAMPDAAASARQQPMTAPQPQPVRGVEIAPVASPAAVPAPRMVEEVQVARIAPAAQVFAAAIQRASVGEDQPSAAAPQSVLAMLPAGTDTTIHAVAAMADPHQSTLDMKRDDWPQQMIQRIDALRDAANANDATIRLIPDALGKIDVSLKREGEGVSVRLDAHQPETRQILADAQPRLVELAEARGLKLSAVTGGASDMTGHLPSQQQQQQRAAPIPAAPAPVTAQEDETFAADDRIA